MVPEDTTTRKTFVPRCHLSDQSCDKPGAPGDLECLCCILGEIRRELALINENLGRSG